MEDVLQKLSNTLSLKDEYAFKIQTTKSDYTLKFSNDLILKKDTNYKIGFLWGKFTNSISNITNENNIFSYYNGTEWKTVEIPSGAYEIDQLNSKIQSLVVAQGDSGSSIIFSLDIPLVSVVMTLLNGYKVDFTKQNNVGSNLLGFVPNLYDSTSYSTNLVDLGNVIIDIECSLVSTYFVNGHKTNILVSFPLLSPSGGDFYYVPQHIIWLPINSRYINDIHFRLKQNGKYINFRGYTSTFVVSIKQA